MPTPSELKLLDLLNEANVPEKLLSAANVRLVSPVPEDHNGRNTRLTIESIPGRGYFGEVDIFYRRIPLTDHVADQDVVRSEVPLTAEALIQLLNSTYGLFLSVDDFDAFSVPELTPGSNELLTLTAKTDSLGWLGSITIDFTYGKPYLDAVVGTKALNVMNHPVELGGLQSARMLTWNVDFSSIRDAILPNGDGTYSDWATVQGACASIDIPPWEQGSIQDYPTSAVPTSNQAFDRVVVQMAVVSDSLIGPIFLHYNTFDEA